MTRRTEPDPELIRVPASADLSQQLLRLHISRRHPLLGYWNRGEHDADHRLHQNRLDHVHKDPETSANP